MSEQIPKFDCAEMIERMGSYLDRELSDSEMEHVQLHLELCGAHIEACETDGSRGRSTGKFRATNYYQVPRAGVGTAVCRPYLVLVWVEYVVAGHRNSNRRQCVEYPNGRLVLLKHFRESLIDVW